MEDWFKPNGLPSINKEFTYLLYLLTYYKSRRNDSNDVFEICVHCLFLFSNYLTIMIVFKTMISLCDPNKA